MSLAGILKERSENEKKTKVITGASQAIRNLKRQNKALEERTKFLRKQICEGNLEVGNTESKDNDENTVSTESAELLYRISKSNQKLEGLACLTGITAIKQGNQIVYMFDPFVQGKHKGTYFIKFGPSYTLLDHNIPAGINVRKLYKETFDARKQNSSENLKDFLKIVFRYLRSLLSREQQVEDLKDGDLALYLKHVETKNHFTNITVTLQIREEGNEEANLVEIGLEYEMDGERPIPGSLQVKVPENWEEALDSMIEQCQVLYKSRLKEAILSAFEE